MRTLYTCKDIFSPKFARWMIEILVLLLLHFQVALELDKSLPRVAYRLELTSSGANPPCAVFHERLWRTDNWGDEFHVFCICWCHWSFSPFPWTPKEYIFRWFWGMHQFVELKQRLVLFLQHCGPCLEELLQMHHSTLYALCRWQNHWPWES